MIETNQKMGKHIKERKIIFKIGEVDQICPQPCSPPRQKPSTVICPEHCPEPCPPIFSASCPEPCPPAYTLICPVHSPEPCPSVCAPVCSVHNPKPSSPVCTPIYPPLGLQPSIQLYLKPCSSQEQPAQAYEKTTTEIEKDICLVKAALQYLHTSLCRQDINIQERQKCRCRIRRLTHKLDKLRETLDTLCYPC